MSEIKCYLYSHTRVCLAWDIIESIVDLTRKIVVRAIQVDCEYASFASSILGNFSVANREEGIDQAIGVRFPKSVVVGIGKFIIHVSSE